MRNRSTGLRRVAAVGAALAVALGTGVGGAAAAEDEAVVTCQYGYVCLQPLLGARPVMVKEGERATFNPALQVTEVTNMTRVAYCVGGGLSYALPPGGTQTWDSSVFTVGPMPVPGACAA
ncbi:hypothetical protein [Streptomyces sp. MB09-02B]|uniref:hypothetical protein n=1 Tax=Streptomyces sp. MB09-02B TaxID=3028667 RepID=UPI0029B76515|nr:hypothetical protein [Streptomyces sp. MB09-02B]MDX3645502.1 hypothetical protein [Streptomyces sp. MB09-02B]